MKIDSPRSRLAVGLLLALVCAMFLFTRAAIANADSLTIAYTGNLEGHLEPCGCAAESDFGGLDRHAVWLDRLRAERPEMIAIAQGGLLTGGGVTERIKAEFILRGFALLNYDAIALRWPDLAFGRELLAHTPLPWTASNWRGNDWALTREIARGGRKVTFLSWLDPETAPKTTGGAAIYPLDATTISLAERIAQARKEGNLVILAATGDAASTGHLPLTGVDLLLLDATETMGEPTRLGETLVLHPGKWGMHAGILDLQVDAQGRVIAWQHRVASLGADLGHAPRMADWHAAYTERVRAASRERVAVLRAQRQGETGPFLGAQKCQACHPRPFAAWSSSRHAQALSTLERVNKGFDPDCLVCHTVGFNRPGGFIDTGVTPQLAGVQCESCHGPGREHVQEGHDKKMPPTADQTEALCRGCHNALHAPAFEFKHFRRRGIPCGHGDAGTP
ncbi:MAG: hypothetical protein HQL66_07900 [Magnetococcales bacterium]|nr:hypothetical protein [Magnetococcales bacterium]